MTRERVVEILVGLLIGIAGFLAVRILDHGDRITRNETRLEQLDRIYAKLDDLEDLLRDLGRERR